MKKWTNLLLLILSLSVALNFYLLSITPNNPIFEQFKANHHDASTNTSAAKRLNRTLTEQQTDKTSQTQLSVFSNAQENNDQFNQSVSNRVELLTQANRWLEEKNFLTLTSFLQGYLKQYPQDMDFLLLEAKLKVQTTLLSDAIAHYYDLLRKPMTTVQQDEIERQIQQLGQNTIEQLKRNYSWDILAMFIEPLIQLEPSNRYYILSLAQAYAELIQEGLMENVLASLDVDDPDAKRIRDIIIALKQGPLTNEENVDTVTANLGQQIPLKQFGNHYVVEAKLSSNPVALLIDTGASVTAISEQYFDNLSNRYKVNYLGSFSIGTAGGNIMARMYQFKELTIKHVTVENLPVVILPMQSIENADGLLGMNFLREFDFKIDQRQSVMFIK